LQKAVADRKREGQKWEDHEWAPNHYNPSHPWPFNIPLNERPQPSSYCPGPGKPADTLNGKCLSCAHHSRKCHDGRPRQGACTTCRGAGAIRAYLKGEEAGDGGNTKDSTATGKCRTCYWPQREFFLNDHDSAKLFHKDAWYNNHNTAEAKRERAERARALKEAEENAGSKAAAAPPRQQAQRRTAAHDTPSAPARRTGLEAVRTPVSQGSVSAAVQATNGGHSVEAPTLPTRDFTYGPALLAESAVNDQRSDYDLTTDQDYPQTSRVDEPTVNSQGTKRGRADDLDEPGVPSKRARGGDVFEGPVMQSRAHPTPESLTSGGAAKRIRNDDDSNSQVSPKRPRRENSSTQLGSLSTPQAPLPAPAASLDDVHSKDVDAVTVSYRKLLKLIDEHMRNGNLWGAAGVQAVVNVAGNDRARALRLFRSPDAQVLLERSKLVVHQSGITRKQMVDDLRSIQARHASSNDNVSDEDRATALRIQAAFNLTSNREYGAPALYAVNHPILQPEAERVARETSQGPFGAHWSLTAQQRLTILLHASDVRSDVVRRDILTLLRPYGLDLDNFLVKGNEWLLIWLLPDHVARVVEHMVATRPQP